MRSVINSFLNIFSSPQRFWAAVLDVAFILSLAQLAKILFDKRYESDEVFKTNIDTFVEAFCMTEAYQDPLLCIVKCICQIIPYLVLFIQIYLLMAVFFIALGILAPIVLVYLLAKNYATYLINLDLVLMQKIEAYPKYKESVASFLVKLDPTFAAYLPDCIVLGLAVISLLVGGFFFYVLLADDPSSRPAWAVAFLQRFFVLSTIWQVLDRIDRKLMRNREAYLKFTEAVTSFLFKIDPTFVAYLPDFIVFCKVVISLIVGGFVLPVLQADNSSLKSYKKEYDVVRLK